MSSVDSEPKLVDIKEIKLYNPERDDKEYIEKVDIEGDNLAGHEYIEDLQDDGYVTRGFTARVKFENELFDIAFSGSDMMGYAKVEDIGDYSKAQRLMDDIRGRYMDFFRGV